MQLKVIRPGVCIRVAQIIPLGAPHPYAPFRTRLGLNAPVPLWSLRMHRKARHDVYHPAHRFGPQFLTDYLASIGIYR
jgi:hypothetical protein